MFWSLSCAVCRRKANWLGELQKVKLQVHGGINVSTTSLTKCTSCKLVVLLFAIALLVPQPLLAGHTQVIVYQHVFSKGIDKAFPIWRPVNVTYTFVQDDIYVYAFTQASFKAHLNFTWRWYDEVGILVRSDTQPVQCEKSMCEFYNTLPLKGTAAAGRLGSWYMDLLADDLVLYSDHFAVVPRVEREDAFIFDVKSPGRVRVNLTETIHPYQEEWNNSLVRIPEPAENFTAYERDTGRILRLATSRGSNDPEDSSTKVNIIFDSPQADGYDFTLSFDLAGAFGVSENGFFLRWWWNDGVHPNPVTFKVILQEALDMVDLLGPSDYTKNVETGRVVISFAGTAPPNRYFTWKLIYRITTMPTTVTSTVPASQLGSLALGAGVVAIALVLIARRRLIHF